MTDREPDAVTLNTLRRGHAAPGGRAHRGRVRHTCDLYNGAAHGFTMADTAVYDAAATERHWERLLDLFARNLLTRGITGDDPSTGSPARD